MGDFYHPVWLVQYLLVAVLFGAMVGFPIYFWIKDLNRRKEERK